MKFKIKPLTLLIALHAATLLLTLVFLAKNKGVPPRIKDTIVILPIEGVISMDGSMRGNSVESLLETLQALREKDHVKAVVLSINSPGGSVGATQALYDAVIKLRAKGKIVVASFGDVSASGGYYLACASDRIFCYPGSLTGSIGVVMQLPNMEGLLKKVGLSMRTIKSGSMKDSGSPFREMSDAEQAYFKTVIMDAYDQFFEAVKKGRKMDDATLKPLADGRIFSGRMALQNKLVDELGSLDDAVEAAKKLSGLEGKKPNIVTHRERPTLGRLLGIVSQSPVKEVTEWSRAQMKLLYVLQ